ncbi:phosphoesterase PA-phosphatase [Micromonospora sp. NPDC049102]|uniref:phosphoesterase PA-phosphatase n=1 Tax=Micromonospora sp. NPDC049102 TaxID=3364265 RepID=UPI0037130DD7
MTATLTADSRTARRVTDWLDPKTWIIAVSFITGWTAGRWTGLGWGIVSAVFAAVIPVLLIKRGVSAGRWADRHLGVRSHRLTVMTLILTSVGIGIGAMAVGDAPRAVIALTLAMFATLAALAVVTLRWKISVHTAVAAGATTMLASQLPALAIAALAVVVAAVGWSRVALHDHTTAQVVDGGLLGTIVAGLIFAGLT